MELSGIRLLPRLLSAWLILGCLCGAYPPRPDPYHLDQVVADMSYPGVKIEVYWKQCGMVNAYYDPNTQTITLCNELVDKVTPGQIRFYLAHEISHAIIQQLEIPYTGSQEVAADELASYVFILTDREKDIQEVANWFLLRGYQESPWDPHPGDVRRGLYLQCFAHHNEAEFWCTRGWPELLKTWNKLLKIS